MPTMAMAEDLISGGEAARLLGVTREAVRKIARRGELVPLAKIGRFPLYSRLQVETLGRRRERRRARTRPAA